MGCKSSKNFNSLPPIEHNFTPTSDEALDAFFIRASDLLLKTENIRQQIFVSKQKGVSIAGTANCIESPYTQAVQVLFWALSAAKQGSIMKARVVLTENKSPYGALSTQDYCRETLELFGTLQSFLLILSETQESLQTLVQDIQKLKDEQIEIKKGIDPTKNPKTAKVIDNNMKKLTDSITTSAKVLSQVPDEQKNAHELLKYIQTLMRTVDEVGIKAYQAGLVKPAEIYKMAENERKKLEKANKANGEKTKNSSAKIGSELDNHEQSQQKTGQSYELKPSQNNGNNNNGNGNVIQAESVPIGQATNYSQATKTQEYQQHGTGELGGYPPSFGEIKNTSQTQNQQNQQNQNNHSGKLNFDPSQQDPQNPSNNSGSIYGHMQQKQNGDEERKPDQGAKKVFFLSNEGTVDIPEVDPSKRVGGPGPGYLSPGGSKQAGILQRSENVADDEGKRSFAHDSNAAKGFSGKANSYLKKKN